MNRLARIVVFVGLTATWAAGEDSLFRKTRIYDSQGKAHKVDLVFQDAGKAIVVREKTSVLNSVAYDAVSSVAYEHASRYRVREGVETADLTPVPDILTPVLLPIGLATMFTKEKKHWLSIDYKDPAGVSRTLVLWLDKKEYKKVLATVKAQTGKDVKMPPPNGK